jgi:hypothetical protein
VSPDVPRAVIAILLALWQEHIAIQHCGTMKAQRKNVLQVSNWQKIIIHLIERYFLISDHLYKLYLKTTYYIKFCQTDNKIIK